MSMSVTEFEVEGAGSEVEQIDIGTAPPEIELPKDFKPSYTEQDRSNVGMVISWLNRTRKPQAWLARVSRIDPGTLNSVLRGKYPSPPSKFLTQAVDALQVQGERLTNRGVPFIETSVWRLAVSVYHRARVYRNIGVFSGYAGTGKTTAALEYERRTPNVYVIECIEKMSASAFLDRLCERLQLTYEARGASREKKFFHIQRALQGTDSLLIVDEAENLGPETLEYCRRLRDLAQIGVVLQGKQNLLALIKPEHGRFDQIRSRIGFWPKVVGGIKREDADQVALAAFDDIEGGVDRATLDAMWDVCGGSIRLLTESLIPCIRDFGLRKGRSFGPALVRQIATEAMRMSPNNSRDGDS